MLTQELIHRKVGTTQIYEVINGINLNKMWHIHTIEHILAIKKKKKDGTAWRNPENIVLSERSQIQKATYYMIPFIENSRMCKSIETESA